MFPLRAARSLTKIAAGGLGLGGVFAWQTSRFTFAKDAGQGLSPDEFRPVTCLANEEHTHNTHKITFELPAGDQGRWNPEAPVANIKLRIAGVGESGNCCACCGCGVGCDCPIPAGKTCCACCKCEVCECPSAAAAGECKPVVRPYNPIDPEQKGSFTLLVKKYEGGKMGSHLHALSPGDVLEAKGPNRQWQFEAGKFAEYGMIAGGTGLTPIMQATRYILANDTATVSMLCFNKTPEDILLQDELNALQKAYPDRFTVHHVVEAGDVAGQHLHGLCDAGLVRTYMPEPGQKTMVMLCGRASMKDLIAGPKAKDWSQGELGGILARLGYDQESVWKL